LRKIRVAVAGAGALGSVHARVLSRLEGAELAGVFDIDRTRAAQVAKEQRTRALTSLDAITREAEACVVAVPTAAHLEVATALLRSKVACLVEKPLAKTAAEARLIVDAARQAGVPLMVGHVGGDARRLDDRNLQRGRSGLRPRDQHALRP
jgi:predicted dehydrogenase